MLRVAFMGSPAFAVPCLEALRTKAEVALVVTQPDKPSGRGMQLAPTAVRAAAEAAGLPVETPPSLKKPPYAPRLAALDLDLIVVVAYGKILPADVLAVPRLGCWNVHASLLPRHRGAAPIQAALLSGDAETGVTLMQMDPGLDTGPMLLHRSMPIGDDDTSGSLHDALSRLGAEALVDGLARLEAGTLAATPQDDARATYAPMLEKEGGRVDWTKPAAVVGRHVRAMDPWPGAFTTLDGQTLKLWRPRVVEASPGFAPGAVIRAAQDGIVVACGEEALEIAEAQLPGKKRLAAHALVAGRQLRVGPNGSVLGT